MLTIHSTLQNLALGEPQAFRNLTAFPLLQSDAGTPGYITLADAMNRGTASITEVSEGGSVPELLLDNGGDRPVLILDGEELLGAKQNRIANLTVLAAAHSKTLLPVSCVEQGRWRYESRAFHMSNRTMFHRARAVKAARVSDNMKATGTYGANQGEVWDHIQAKQARMHVESATGAMADMYEQHDRQVEDYAQAFVPVAQQVGVIFAIDNRVEGMDLFDAHATLATMLPKLARSFAIDALESATDAAKPADRATAERFLDRIAAAKTDSYPAVGLGNDVRFAAPQVAGGGLVYEDRLIHLAAFSVASAPAPEQESLTETRLRASRYARMRRRNEQH